MGDLLVVLCGSTHGSRPRSAASCPAGTPRARACGSSAPCSLRWLTAQRPGALERAGLVIAEWHDTRERLAATGARMVAVLDELGLTELVTTIAGLTPSRRGDHPGRDRRPEPVRHPQVTGQARRAVPARQRLRRLLGQDIHLRPRPARAASSRVAGGVGGAAEQPGAGRQVHPPDHSGRQPAGPPAGPHRVRRRTAALDPRRHHPAGQMGRGHRRRRNIAVARSRVNAS